MSSLVREALSNGTTRWPIRSMAAEAGLSHTTIRRIWNAFGLQPQRHPLDAEDLGRVPVPY